MLKILGDRYVRVTPVETLTPRVTYTLSQPSGFAAFEMVVAEESDLEPPGSVEVLPPEVTAPNTPGHFLTNIPSGQYRYRFPLEGSLADAVVIELRDEDTNAFLGTEISRYEFISYVQFITEKSPDGRFYLDLVDAAGNRTRTNSVEVKGGCSSSQVPTSRFPFGIFVSLGLLFLGMRRG